jgi:hypothetical protein
LSTFDGGRISDFTFLVNMTQHLTDLEFAAPGEKSVNKFTHIKASEAKDYVCGRLM